MKGIYIHIPFCHQICHYCDFNKVFFKNQPVDGYIESVGTELQLMKSSGISFDRVETIFLGGGTPTALSEKQLGRLLEILHEYVNVSAVTEFSTEANPDELTAGKLAVLKSGGVNRLSIGVQSFDESLLKTIGRSHSPKDAVRVVEEARKAGFENISIDLIYALPNQTAAQWQQTLDTAFELQLPHYSGYSLIVEPKTIFYNLMNKGKLPLPGEDAEAGMFAMLIDQMQANGNNRYEISNFAKPGFESLHNLLYWDNENYAGIGAGAHGYLGTRRYSNIAPLNQYMSKLEKGILPVQQTHEVTKREQMEEEMFLGLRKSKGVSYKQFEAKFGISLDSVYHSQIDKLVHKGLLTKTDNEVYLSDKGVFQGNEAFQQFLLTE